MLKMISLFKDLEGVKQSLLHHFNSGGVVPVPVKYSYKDYFTGQLRSDQIKSAGDLRNKKMADYGPANLSQTGSLGIIIRMIDKITRLENLSKDGKEPNYESIEDTLIDLYNYSVLLLEFK